MKKTAILICFMVMIMVVFIPFTVSAWDLKCSSCQGSGKCSHCNGIGSMACDNGSCAGSGETNCVTCVAGRIDCPDCDVETTQSCATCEGEETVDCSDCAGTGKIGCSQCESTGVVACPWCTGFTNNTLVGKCATCGGDGRVFGGEGEPTKNDFDTYGDRILDYTAPSSSSSSTSSSVSSESQSTASSTTSSENTSSELPANAWWEWINSANSGNSIELANVEDNGIKLLSIQLVKNKLTDTEKETIKNLTDDDIAEINTNLKNVSKTVNFSASLKAIRRFRKVASNAEFVDLNFEQSYNVGFKLGIAAVMNDPFLVPEKEYFAYRYDEEADKIVSLGKASITVSSGSTVVAFFSDSFDEIFISDFDLTTALDNENQADDKVQMPEYGGYDLTTKIIVISVSVALGLALAIFLCVKVFKK